MSDQTNGQAYWTAIGSVDFQNRCTLQFAMAAEAVTTEDPATPSHQPRLAFAGQLLADQFPRDLQARWILTNTTIQGEVVTDFDAGHPPGTSVPDSDLAFVVVSLFTGLATSLPTTAQSPI